MVEAQKGGSTKSTPYGPKSLVYIQLFVLPGDPQIKGNDGGGLEGRGGP